MNDPAAPDRGVQRGELVVAGRDHRAEVLLEDLRVLAQRGVGVQEDDAQFLQILTDGVVDDLRLVLGGDTGDQSLLLGFGDAQPVVGVLDVRGQIVPGRGLLLAGAHEVLDVVEVDALEVGAPVRHRLAPEDAQRLQPVSPASTPARSSSPRCRGPQPRTARAARWRRRRRSPTSRSRTGPARRWSLPGSAAAASFCDLGGGRHDDAPWLLVVASARAVRRRVRRFGFSSGRAERGWCRRSRR